ncbi:MAG: CvpA family protein [bacterium]
MYLDILFSFALILTTGLGFRDGLVRKLVSIAFTVGGVFLAQYLMHDAAVFLKEQLVMDASAAPIIGYFMIFFGVLFIQSILYRAIAKRYKMGGIADKIFGSFFGLVQGAFVLSVILIMLATQGWPDKRTSKESRLYPALIVIAPQITDVAANLESDARESLDKISLPAGSQEQEATPEQKPASTDEEFANKMREKMKERDKAVDSLYKNARNPARNK